MAAEAMGQREWARSQSLTASLTSLAVELGVAESPVADLIPSFSLNRATLDSQDPEAHLAWMAVMELKELLDFQALMAIPGFSDHPYAVRSLYIISNVFACLQVCPIFCFSGELVK